MKKGQPNYLTSPCRQLRNRLTQLSDITVQAASKPSKKKRAKPCRGRERTAASVAALTSVALNVKVPRGTVRHACETGKLQQDSSPTRQNHPAKNSLTLLSELLKVDEERPTQLSDITMQAASKPYRHASLTSLARSP